MKLGLISDIHGDSVALERAWGHLLSRGADHIVCAGDLVDCGPWPDAVVEFLQTHGIESARGNHDRWAVRRGPGAIDEFGGGTPSAASLEYLKRLPFSLSRTIANRAVTVVHATPTSDMEAINPRDYPPSVVRSCLGYVGSDIMVFGHTHTPMWHRCDRGLVVNPGSALMLPVARTSRTCAIVDLETLEVVFLNVDDGQEVNVPCWDDVCAAREFLDPGVGPSV